MITPGGNPAKCSRNPRPRTYSGLPPSRTREQFHREEYLGISRWGKEVTAMRPYSLDLRERVAAAIDHHDGSIRWIARVFRVSTSFIVRLLQRRRATGTLATEAHRPRPSGPPTWSG